jgi:hypothetical protein
LSTLSLAGRLGERDRQFDEVAERLDFVSLLVYDGARVLQNLVGIE